MLVNKN